MDAFNTRIPAGMWLLSVALLAVALVLPFVLPPFQLRLAQADPAVPAAWRPAGDCWAASPATGACGQARRSSGWAPRGRPAGPAARSRPVGRLKLLIGMAFAIGLALIAAVAIAIACAEAARASTFAIAMLAFAEILGEITKTFDPSTAPSGFRCRPCPAPGLTKVQLFCSPLPAAVRRERRECSSGCGARGSVMGLTWSARTRTPPPCSASRPSATELIAFVLSAVLTSIGGVLYGYSLGFISTGSVFRIDISLNLILSQHAGRHRHGCRPAIGAALMIVLTQAVLGDLLDLHMALTGAVLIAMVTLAPKGITGLVHQLGIAVTAPPSPRRDDPRRRRPDLAVQGPARHPRTCRLPSRRAASPASWGRTAPGNRRLFTHDLRLSQADRRAASFSRAARLLGKAPHLVHGMGIARAFQIAKPFPELSVEKNVLVAATFGRLGPRDPQATTERAIEISSPDGLAESRPASVLSIGNLRRLELARAIAARPALLLADEPCAGLNETETREVIGVLSTIRDTGVTVLLVEHDIKQSVGPRPRHRDRGRPQDRRRHRRPSLLRPSRDRRLSRYGRRMRAPATGLALEGIDFAYGGARALNGVSLAVLTGGVVALLGSNGAGKSTTAKVIAGALRPARGTIVFDGEPIAGLPSHLVMRRGVVLVPEGRLVFAQMTIQDNLMMGAYKENRRARVVELLEQNYARFPRLKERRHQLAGSLSGGEQQMLAIARGLMAEPRLLVLDEPSLGIMPKLVQEIFALIRQIAEQGVSILLIERMRALRSSWRAMPTCSRRDRSSCRARGRSCWPTRSSRMPTSAPTLERR